MTCLNEDRETAADRQGRDDVADAMAFVELALRARGVLIDVDAVDRVHRVLDGSLTREQARAEIAAKYGLELPAAGSGPGPGTSF